MNFSAGNIVASIVFSGIGFVAFTYGRREDRFQTMALGGVMMVYPYFTPSALPTCIVGVVLTLVLYFFHD